MIDEEFRMTCYVVALSFIGFIGSLFVMALAQESVRHLTTFASLMFSLSAPSFVATVWIPRKLKKDETLRMMERAHGPLVLKEGLFKDRGFNPDGTETTSLMEEIRNVFLDEQKMKVLARWMIRDSTLESFLAFVEMVQFKESIITIIKEQNEHFVEGNQDRQRYKLHEHCPKSSIVFIRGLDMKDFVVEMEEILEDHENDEMAPNPTPNEVAKGNINPMVNNKDKEQDEERGIELMDSDMYRLKKCAHLLFDKYIDMNSALEINIGHEERGRHYQLEGESYASLKPLDWVALYDQVLPELWEYIMQSYGRMISNFFSEEQEESEEKGR